MKQIITSAVILGRINYGEADRIITALTPDNGKLHLMVRGARRAKSKLAGGIELFSVSDITFSRGRGDVGTLISSRLKRHFGDIVKDIERVDLGYEILRLMDKNTEDEVEADYYNLLVDCLEALDDAAIADVIIRIYFRANMLRLAGHSPNLATDDAGDPLKSGSRYGFDAAAAGFVARGDRYNSDHIKFLRLVFAGHSPRALARIGQAEALARHCLPLVQAMLQRYLRI